MPNFNKVILMGMATAAPDLRQTPNGTNVTEVNLHLRRKWTNPQGEEKLWSDWVDVTFWGRTAETICQYIQKGRPLFVEGRLSFRAWESKEGQKRSKVDVTAENFQFISPPSEQGGGGQDPEDSIPYFNKVFVMGNLTRDPELRSAGPDRSVTTVALAVNRNWSDSGGQKQEETAFIDVDFWGNEAEEVCRLYKKGTPLFVEGRLTKQSWDDKTTGEKRSKVCVTGENFLLHEAYGSASGNSHGGGFSSESGDPGPTEPAPEAPHIDPMSQEDEEVPF